MRVTGSRIVQVSFPLFTTASGAIISHGDNVLAYNTNAGSFTSTVPTPAPQPFQLC